MAENKVMLAVMDRMLEPNYLLSAGLSIDLHPGESPRQCTSMARFTPCHGRGLRLAWA
jgi:hypothetical protein